MKTITAKKLISHFTEVLDQVNAGVEFEVVNERKDVVGYFTYKTPKNKLKIGLLKHKGNVVFKDGFKITYEELFRP